MTRLEGMRGWLLAMSAVFISISEGAGSSQALAATTIKQESKAQLDAKSAASRHTWTIDGGKFHLVVAGDSGQTDFIFNGRNFYICGKFNREDLAYLQSHQIESGKLADQFKNGVCQAVPNNFLVRFFIAQASAVEALDRTDGMLLTLSMNQHTVQASGKTLDIAGQKCRSFTRQYELQKTASNNVSARIIADDSLCLAASPDWRSGLWTEVKKSLMRQPQGQKLLAKLSEEREELRGFPLSMESKLTIVDTAGKKHASTISLQTTAITSEKAKPSAFKIPPGYSIISPENIDQLIPEAKANTPKPVATKEDAANFYESIHSVLLCAIAGTLGCLVNP